MSRHGGSAHRFSTTKRWRIFSKSAGLCFFCGCRFDRLHKETKQKGVRKRKYAPNNLTFDHVTPKVEGGTDAIENIVASCADCNNKKGCMSMDEFRAFKGGFWAERYGYEANSGGECKQSITVFCANLHKEIDTFLKTGIFTE